MNKQGDGMKILGLILATVVYMPLACEYLAAVGNDFHNEYAVAVTARNSYEQDRMMERVEDLKDALVDETNNKAQLQAESTRISASYSPTHHEYAKKVDEARAKRHQKKAEGKGGRHGTTKRGALSRGGSRTKRSCSGCQ